MGVSVKQVRAERARTKVNSVKSCSTPVKDGWENKVHRFVAGVAILPLLLAATPTAAAANLTVEQLTKQCGPQLAASIPGFISHLEVEVAEWQQGLKESPDDKDRGDPIIHEDQQEIASLRADGIEGTAMRAVVEGYRQAGSKNSKIELSKALREARSAPGLDAAAAACMLEAVLANREAISQATQQALNARPLGLKGAPRPATPGLSQTVTGVRPITTPLPMPKQPPALVNRRAPRLSRLKPTPHLSDDQKVFNAMLGLDKDKQAARAACKARLETEDQRIDALDITFEADAKGNPVLRFRNNTELQLAYKFDVGIDVSGVSRRGIWVGLNVLNPHNNQTWENSQFNTIQDAGKPWAWQKIWNKHVWATPINYEACDRNN